MSEHCSMVAKKKRAQTEIDNTSTSDITVRKRVRSNENAGSSAVVPKTKESSKIVTKSKKGTVSKDKVEDLIERAEEEYVDDVRTHNNNSVLADDDIPDWPEADLMELMKRMENNIPAKDNLRYDSRAEKLNWDEISFGNYSAGECKEVWFKIQKRLRRFRILKELLEDAKSWVSKPWTHFYRSQRQNRHPDLPRRPLSTYMLFYLEKKDKVAKDNPGLEMTNVSKYIAELYNKLPAKKKQKYIDMAAAQKKEYEEKMEQFYQEHPELVPKAVALKEAKAANAASNPEPGPKKLQTPFKLFCNEKLNQHKNDPGFDRTAVLESCKEQWRDMSEKKKIVWIDWALEEEAKYQEEIRAYAAENPEFVPPPLKSVLTKEEIALKERIAGKPEKPPTSGYSLFSRLMLVSPDMKKVPPKERMSQVSRMWKSLTNDQKKKYKEQVLHMLDQYKLEYASYLESLSDEKRQEELSNCAPKKKLPPKNKIGKKVVKKKPKPEEENSKLFKGEPEPPPLNAYQLFLKGFMADASHIPLENREKEAPRYWQMLPAADKEKHRKKLNDIKQKYIKDYEKFLKGLSQEELKEYSMQKAKLKQTEDAQSSEDSDTDDGSKESDGSEKDSDSDANSSSDSDSDSDDSSDSDSDAEKTKGSDDSSSMTSSSDSDSE
ncbi:nucleolar transcription factor 1-A-like isoform X1 [Schistocerca gregaria]|uniref:nucleolar transcription factor 1-A-like isoform X1 n=2 Tax=Schistocerca gregaria TaxID=7010 RepID=UPI00211E2E20|nr:nucleolar transcription factor 1-A-like isoform X1 [Schistocerca gregaria]XP_049858541.1 nucleolar transcription factor 1-A-like isoform X1 [Schistocerca gregaria]